MKQEIVLPKFKIPGQANWLVRGLWIGGGLVVALTGLVVFGLARQQEKELAAQAQRIQAEQAAAAEAAAPKAAPPKAARVAASKTLATRAPLTQASLDPGKPAGLTKRRAGLSGKGKGKARARAGYTLRKKPTRQSKIYATKAAARGGARPAAKKPARKGGDAIDDILRNFK